MTDLAARVAHLEAQVATRTMAERPDPPLSDWQRAKIAADERRRQERAAAMAHEEALAQLERERLAEERRARDEANAPRIAELLAELGPLVEAERKIRDQIRPIEAELRTLR